MPWPRISLSSNKLFLSLGILGVGVVDLSLLRIDGYTGDVTITVMDNPGTLLAVLLPNIFINPLGASVLTFTVGLGTPKMIYPIRIRASGSGVDDSWVTINLTVT